MPRPAIHPGEILRDELAELGVTPTELARQIHVPPNRVTQIIHGQRGVTGDTAIRLGRWFSASPRFWLNLQNAYDLRTAEERIGQDIVAREEFSKAVRAAKAHAAKKAAAKRAAPAKKRA